MAFLVRTIIDKFHDDNSRPGEQPLKAVLFAKSSESICHCVDFAVQHNLIFVLALAGIKEDVVIPAPSDDPLQPNGRLNR